LAVPLIIFIVVSMMRTREVLMPGIDSGAGRKFGAPDPVDLDRSLLSLGPKLPLALAAVAFFSLQPLVAIGYAAFRFFGDTTAFCFSIFYYIIPGGMAALVFGAFRVGQASLRFAGRLRTFFGIVYLALQFAAAVLQAWITGGGFIGGYFAHAITTDFVSLALILCATFVPQAFRMRKWWFFPLFIYAYAVPAAVLVYYFRQDASALNPGSDFMAMVFWACGVAAQVAAFAFSVDFRSWRDYAGRFFNP
jgi:hypothetical protein